jgi:hypothetical protein
MKTRHHPEVLALLRRPSKGGGEYHPLRLTTGRKSVTALAPQDNGTANASSVA